MVNREKGLGGPPKGQCPGEQALFGGLSHFQGKGLSELVPGHLPGGAVLGSAAISESQAQACLQTPWAAGAEALETNVLCGERLLPGPTTSHTRTQDSRLKAGGPALL